MLSSGEDAATQGGAKLRQPWIKIGTDATSPALGGHRVRVRERDPGGAGGCAHRRQPGPYHARAGPARESLSLWPARRDLTARRGGVVLEPEIVVHRGLEVVVA